jgi:hypothetical protein
MGPTPITKGAHRAMVATATAEGTAVMVTLGIGAIGVIRVVSLINQVREAIRRT